MDAMGSFFNAPFRRNAHMFRICEANLQALRRSVFYEVKNGAAGPGRKKEGKRMGQIATEDFQVIDNCLMIRLPEEVDHYGAGYICENADRLLCREGVSNIVFDFENTRFMDSSGIGIIMGRYRKISCFGGRVYAIHADRQIRRILSVSGLEKIVEVLES